MNDCICYFVQETRAYLLELKSYVTSTSSSTSSSMFVARSRTSTDSDKQTN